MADTTNTNAAAATEAPASRRNENQGGERDRYKRGDQIRVSILQLDPVGHSYRDELARQFTAAGKTARLAELNASLAARPWASGA